ncbi:hypothetical protein [Candidatus Rariloculus sp.]|uniref:hypothetical protein n=1 Tax=Candidatus Rariloculus sp. TaxID=3101265 RepID=UPI003D1167A0
MCNKLVSITLAATVLAGSLLAGTARAQSSTRAMPAEDAAAAVVDPDWEVPRTSWGHPDFSGTWSTDDMLSIPRQRPEEFGDRDKLTPEEFAERASNDDEQLDRTRNVQNFSARGERGIRTFGFTSQIIDPPDGRIPPMTEAGLARAAPRDRGTFGSGPFDDFEDFTLYDRCITRGVLGSKFPVVYGNGLRILQTPDSVAISYEMIHDTRIIKLDGRPHMTDDIRQYLGNSRGYWDGDTLVVETHNLTDLTSIGPNGNGTRHSTEMTITERFTRVDPGMIEYTARVEDPVTYTSPFTVRLMLTAQPGYRLYEYSCHEGNGAVDHSLSGERAYDRRAEEAVAAGEPIPERPTGLGPLPEEETEFFDINAGE